MDKQFSGNNKEEVKSLISPEKLKKILDNAYDEIFVYDNNYDVVYVNRACERHYGMKAEAIIGKNFYELEDDENWYPSVLPMVYKKKRRMTIEQKSYLGQTLITTAVPVFDDDENIEFVVMSVRDTLPDIALIRNEFEKNQDNLRKKKSKKLERDEIEIVSDKIIHKSDSMKELISFTNRVSKVDSTIMILGESGAGKGILAKYIHSMSKRCDKSILTLNCAAIPEDLLESELFGYSKGAFTGADYGGKVGLLELADKGTLFLDEIGELSPRLQAKLLHVIQDKQFIPIGSKEIKSVDIRIITATNRDLLELIEQKQFREDLYYRLNVVEIDIPPLRERPDDIIALSNYFINKFNKKYERTCSISKECMNFFIRYHWPGNVRQLMNAVERLVVTSIKPTIEINDLPKVFFRKLESDNRYFPESYASAKESFEKDLVIKAFKRFKTTRKVSEALKISQSKASYLKRRYCPSE
ncbi:sigma-54 interaction domain-containing protein [Anaeromicrobium sediminis]|uniref:Transcriptional regulatory protein TyrR n=1 Tax=Anaeromicrobium sediminis TaxID=1478221 RepID=A0A267MJC8_9FIRM|nr:sigma 54-interacting transcriptional regulator [Anaeromicrobium sediminis]PAB59701.1 hypothetical protein CCE28_09040 [Anaeromicrobium sediminis]